MPVGGERRTAAIVSSVGPCTWLKGGKRTGARKLFYPHHCSAVRSDVDHSNSRESHPVRAWNPWLHSHPGRNISVSFRKHIGIPSLTFTGCCWRY
jgi:hypothetical protein